MDHRLTMHIHQPMSNTFELSGAISSVTGTVCSRIKPYKIEPICISMHLDKLVDVPVDHPFRYHREVVLAHCHSQ